MYVKYVKLTQSDVYREVSDIEGKLVRSFKGLLSYPRAWLYVLRNPNG